MTLEYLDTFIGFSAIMLGVSLIITVLTQIVTILLGLRGRELSRGLETLLKNTSLGAAKAKSLADEVLRHELISDHIAKLGSRNARATAIRLEEFKKILAVLAQNDSVLDAKLQEVKTAIDSWFNSVMDRVTQWYASKSRVVTVAFAVFVSFALQLDSAELLRQLSADAELRASLVGVSADLRETAEGMLETENGASQPTATVPREDPIARLESLVGKIEEVEEDFEESRLQLFTRPYRSFWDWKLFLGLLVSSALLSLGAPFWFKTLGTLSALRPVIAGREEAERRQGARTP